MKRPILCIEKEPIERTLDLCTKPLQVCFENYYRMLDTIHRSYRNVYETIDAITVCMWIMYMFSITKRNDAH